VHAVALPARHLAHLLLLVDAREVEARAVRPRVHLDLAERNLVLPLGDHLVDGLLGIERAALIGVRQLHGLAQTQRAAVGSQLADDHAEERGLAGAVGTDDADDGGRRDEELATLDE